MTTDPTKFVCPGGLPYPTAIELASQIDSTPNAVALVGIGLPDYLGRELEAQMKSGIVNTDRLRELGWCPEVIDAFRTAMEARE